tara:strand:- start:34 stop:936 length:903 start_codon:yes stop_codon:yes gene_type:complete
MKKYILLFLKGMGMGIANAIPGVSGGTIALITEIYEDLINSLKSFDIKALNLIISLNIKEFVEYTKFYFLLAVFGGSVVSVFSIASLFKYLFANYPIFIWAFFFGLILASVYFVGKRVEKWNKLNIIILFIGTAIAVSISFFTPASENDNLFFIFICGIIGVSGMMLPGLSGSFILILMGNYELLMVKAITELDYIVLGVFFIGSVFGLISFSHMLAWVLKHYKDATLALLTGFILGSLNIIWPWKEVVESVLINGKEKVLSYNWYFPRDINNHTIIAIALIIIGVGTVWGLESFSSKNA